PGRRGVGVRVVLEVRQGFVSAEAGGRPHVERSWPAPAGAATQGRCAVTSGPRPTERLAQQPPATTSDAGRRAERRKNPPADARTPRQEPRRRRVRRRGAAAGGAVAGGGAGSAALRGGAEKNGRP